jgi:hypothetical protein
MRHKGSFEKKIIVAWLSLPMKTIGSTCIVRSSETSENICSSNGNIIKKIGQNSIYHKIGWFYESNANVFYLEKKL